MLWWILVAVIILFLFLGLFWWGIRKAIWLAINSAIGFFALYGVQQFFLPELIINWVSVLLTAIFGLLGFIIVVLLHLTGIAF